MACLDGDLETLSSLRLELVLAGLELLSHGGAHVASLGDLADDDLAAGEGDLLGPAESLLSILGLDDPVAADVRLGGDVERTGSNLGAGTGESDAVALDVGRAESLAAEEYASSVERLVERPHGLNGGSGKIAARLGSRVRLDEENVARHGD